MTREEFREQVCDMGCLVAFCFENQSLEYVVENFLKEDDFNEEFEDYVIREVRDYGWESVNEAICNAVKAKNSLTTGYFDVTDFSDVGVVSEADFCIIKAEAESAYDDYYGFDERGGTIQEAIAPTKDEEVVDATLLLELMG